jgi:hypothetical protein
LQVLHEADSAFCSLHGNDKMYESAQRHTNTWAISKSRKVFCSPHVAVPAKRNFHDSALSGGHEKPSGLDA